MNNRLKLAALLCLTLIAGCNESAVTIPQTSKNSSPDGEYIVISLVDTDSGFQRAARLLAERHDADVLQSDPDRAEEMLVELRRRQPSTVAFVVHPDDLEFNLVQRIMLLSTQVDSDPFVDFAYGFITGRDADAAVKLVEASGSGRINRDAAITMFGVGSKQMGKSAMQKAAWPVRGGQVPMTLFQSAGETDETRDELFVKESMPKLAGAPILLLASHGYPDGLSGGPKAADLHGVDLSGSIVLNIACYNGVTNTWYEDDFQSMTVRKRETDAGDSFCLQVIDGGAAAYVAYASPRPAGPTMMGDALLVASSGKSIGELRRADANGVVLAHLLSGGDLLEITPMRDGTALSAGRTPGSIVKRMSTGGMLIGDPALKPFAEMTNSDPRIVTVEEQPDRLIVHANVLTSLFHFYSGEQINYWDDHQAAMRVETAVPLGSRSVREVRVTETPTGIDQYKVVAAVEVNRGERTLRLKIVFAQPTDMKALQKLAISGLSSRFEIITEGESTDNGDSVIFRSNGK